MVVVKGSGVNEAEKSRERRERKTGTAAARETATSAWERDDTSQTEVSNTCMP